MTKFLVSRKMTEENAFSKRTSELSKGGKKFEKGKTQDLYYNKFIREADIELNIFIYLS